MLNLNPETAQTYIDTLANTQEIISIIEKLAPGTNTAGLNAAELVNAFETAFEAKDPQGYATIIDLGLDEQTTFSSLLDSAKKLGDDSGVSPTIDASSPYAGSPAGDLGAKKSSSSSKTTTRESVGYNQFPEDIQKQVSQQVNAALDNVLEDAKKARLMYYLIDTEKNTYIATNCQSFKVDPTKVEAFIAKYEPKVDTDDKENVQAWDNIKNTLRGDGVFKTKINTSHKIIGVEILPYEGASNLDIVTRENLGTYLLTKYLGSITYEGKAFAGLKVTTVVEKTVTTKNSGSKTSVTPVVKFVGKKDIETMSKGTCYKTTSDYMDPETALNLYNAEEMETTVRSEASFKIKDGDKTRTVRVSGKVKVPYFERLPEYQEDFGAVGGQKQTIDMSRNAYQDASKRLLSLLSSADNRAYVEEVMSPDLKIILSTLEGADTTPDAVEL